MHVCDYWEKEMDDLSFIVHNVNNKYAKKTTERLESH